MTHTTSHQYDEILNAALPGLEIHIVYNCESEIVFDECGDEIENRLLSIQATVNDMPLTLPRFPLESHGREAQMFLARLRESARDTLYKTTGQPVVSMAKMFPKFKPVMTGDDGYYEFLESLA